MTEPVVSTVDVQPAPRGRVVKVTRVVRPVLRPAGSVWQTAFRDPVTDSHISLGGLSFAERHLARIGLVALALLLGSVLFTDVWRGGELLPVNEDENLVFLPGGLLPVTLVAFAVAWALLSWGALAASPSIRLVVAAVWVLTNASLAVAASVEVGDHRALRWGPEVVEVGYYTVPAVLVVGALVGWLPAGRWKDRIWRWLLPVLRLVAVAGLLALFLGHLWIHLAFVDEGFQGTVQQLVSGAVLEIESLLLPLVYVSGVLVVDFSLDVAEGVALAGREAAHRLVRWLLVAVIAVKLWLEVVQGWGDWVTYVTDRPDATARTVLSLLLLVVLVRLVCLFAATDGYEDAKEGLLYGSGAAMSLIQISGVLVTGAGVFAVAQLDRDTVPSFVGTYSGEVVDWLLVWGQPIAAAVTVLVGVWLLRRSVSAGATRWAFGRELGSGLVVLGGWAFPSFVLNSLELSPGFSYEMVDVLVTLGVAAYLAARWRRIGAAEGVVLGALVVFAWLALSRGDWISHLGGLLGLPAIIVIVVGIGFSLAGDAGFTRSASKRLPQGARVLLFVGYLVLSVTILHWVEATHAWSVSSVAGEAGFYFLGMPWAAWLVGRRLLRLDDPEELRTETVVEELPVAPLR